MKTESLREVKNNLSRVTEELPKTGAVLITKNGRTRAVLLPVGEDTDLESLLLSQNQRLWELIDRSIEARPALRRWPAAGQRPALVLASGRKRGLTRFEDVPD